MVFIFAEKNKDSLPVQCCIPVRRGQLLCREGQPWQPLSSSELDYPEALHSHYLGTWHGKHCFALFYNEQKDFNVPEGFAWETLRQQFGKISQQSFNIAGRALQMTRWYRDHQFCGVCGSPTKESANDRACVCTACEARFYPRISPCVIGLVTRGPEILLARGVRHPEGMFSTLAGFIEPGENAEEAFAREVKEEVNIEVQNVQYFASQPWPFPGQLMLGFTAEYLAGDIQVDGEEIIEAHWFTPKTIPSTPPEFSISGKLIRHYLNSHGV